MNAHLVTRIAASATGALIAVSAGVAAAPADANQHARNKAGDTSLVEVLGADGTRLDHNWADFDILEQAVLAVLAAKPTSPVGLLADGDVRLTAFAPTDAAFRDLVGDLTGTRPGTEKRTLKKIVELTGAATNVSTLETILLYHVVPGTTLPSPKVIKAAEKVTRLTTAQGGTVKVKLRKGTIVLKDKDPDISNATVILAGVDINRGDKQIAHAIDRVLLPVDL